MAKPQRRPRLKYRVDLYDANHKDGEHYTDYTEAEILGEYWEHWSSEMTKKFGADHPLITKENCIEDWVVCHWAQEIK